MRRHAIAAGTTTVFALFLAAVPVSADTEYVGMPPSIDWRLVAILSVLAIAVFYVVLERVNRGR